MTAAATRDSPDGVAELPRRAALDVAAPCPLCGYDLRGLAEGRCPECGHRFKLSRVRAVRLAQRADLFEHHAGRPVRGFIRTLMATSRPARFWTRLQPTMTVVPRRLAAYAAICLAIAMASSLGGSIVEIALRTHVNLQDRRAREGLYQSAAPRARTQMDMRYPPGSGGYLAATRQRSPLPTEAHFWEGFAWRESTGRGLPLAALALLWPVTTAASLLVFWRTLRQARIRRGHVARVIIYSGDVFGFIIPALVAVSILAALGLAPVNGFVYVAPFPIREIMVMLPGIDASVLLVGVVMLSVSGWRLWQAHRHYLRLPGSAAMVVSSQVMVWLAALAVGGFLMR